MRKVLLVFACSLLVTAAAFAQGTGTIHGTLTDPTGLAVAKSQVMASLGERGATRTVETDVQGAYVFNALSIGTYTLVFEAPGFKPFRRDGVLLSANENIRVDVELTLGSVTESV